MTYSSNKFYFDNWEKANGQARVFIVLKSAKIYTVVSRQEMFDKGLFRGCFLETSRLETAKQSAIQAVSFIKEIGARYVSLDEFHAIEKAGETEWVAKAFATAEQMIANG